MRDLWRAKIYPHQKSGLSFDAFWDDALSRGVYEARSAHERLTLRAEQVSTSAQTLARRIERAERELEASEQPVTFEDVAKVRAP